MNISDKAGWPIDPSRAGTVGGTTADAAQRAQGGAAQGVAPAPAAAAAAAAQPAAPQAAVSVAVSLAAHAVRTGEPGGESEVSDAELVERLRGEILRGDYRIDYDRLSRALVDEAVASIRSRP